MQEPSSYYRDDAIDILPGDINQLLDDNFLSKLDNLEETNPKMLVVFSGGNALGKTTLSKNIGSKLHGLVIENDAIKKTIKDYNNHLSREELNKYTWAYSMNLYARLEKVTPNGLIVRDGIIDWYYDRILPIFEKQGYKIFVIGFDVTSEKRIELIMKRGDTETTTTDRLMQLVDIHDKYISRFRTIYVPDISLNDTNLFNHDRVLRAIEKELHN